MPDEFFLRPYPLGHKQVQGGFVIPSGKFFLSHTALHDRFVLRLAVGNVGTTRDDVRAAWEMIQKATGGE